MENFFVGGCALRQRIMVCGWVSLWEDFEEKCPGDDGTNC